MAFLVITTISWYMTFVDRWQLKMYTGLNTKIVLGRMSWVLNIWYMPIPVWQLHLCTSLIPIDTCRPRLVMAIIIPSIKEKNSESKRRRQLRVPSPLFQSFLKCLKVYFFLFVLDFLSADELEFGIKHWIIFAIRTTVEHLTNDGCSLFMVSLDSRKVLYITNCWQT